MFVAVVFGLVARQRHQPGFGFKHDSWFLARSRTIVDGRQRAIGHRALGPALHHPMIDAKFLAYRAKRRNLPIRQQHLRPRHPARQFDLRPRKCREARNLFIALTNSTARRILP